MAKIYSIDQLIRDEWEKSSGVTSTPEQKFTPEQKHWVEEYRPSNRSTHCYYRYVWMEGQKLRHRHIPGGNTTNPKARALKEKVELAIALGKSPIQIERLIKGQ